MENNQLEQYYTNLSDHLLKELHDGAKMAYKNDQSMTNIQKEQAMSFCSNHNYYGTDVEQDWPLHVDAIEAVMTRKGIAFSAIEK